MGEAEITQASKAPPLDRGQRHPTVHFVLLFFNLLIALACFVGAGILVIGQRVLTDTKKTAALASPIGSDRPTISLVTPNSGAATGETSPASVVDGTVSTDPTAPTTTEAFPDADPQARNFLITGSDNDACPDANSLNPVEDRGTLGERSDTIMVMRVDPSSGRAAVLSFPRDLWVKIDGTNGRNRINSAYSVNDPQKLVNTIYLNFFIPIDHYIQIDFCAFKELVDAVGGVSVYFQYPARDKHTGLDVPVTDGCYTFNGDSALAYVRSRHYQYLNPKTNKFTEDPASDYGRISRQQDFLRRAVAKVLSAGYSLSVARSLIDVATKYVVVDKDLTLDKELQFAGVLKNLDPNAIQTYQVEGVGKVIGGAAVIEPRLDGENMQAILKIFQGKTQLASAPTQVFETTTTVGATTTTSPTTSGTTVPGASTTTSSSAVTTTTAPSGPTTTLAETSATEITRGIFPPKDKTCP
ncbi:MAG: putative LytR family regulatory protein [Ilumatobacteraceae bacterium]|nr:putative LytR family regulatory protein [Ilumatobacteraceae bacterium]